jgi:large subunit ribosomal protein L31e
MIREFATKHMKTEDVKLDQELNRHVWRKGKTNPPRKVRVKMVKDENDTLVVSLFEETKAETKTKPQIPCQLRSDEPSLKSDEDRSIKNRKNRSSESYNR